MFKQKANYKAPVFFFKFFVEGNQAGWINEAYSCWMQTDSIVETYDLDDLGYVPSNFFLLICNVLFLDSM